MGNRIDFRLASNAERLGKLISKPKFTFSVFFNEHLTRPWKGDLGKTAIYIRMRFGQNQVGGLYRLL